MKYSRLNNQFSAYYSWLLLITTNIDSWQLFPEVYIFNLRIFVLWCKVKNDWNSWNAADYSWLQLILACKNWSQRSLIWIFSKVSKYIWYIYGYQEHPLTWRTSWLSWSSWWMSGWLESPSSIWICSEVSKNIWYVASWRLTVECWRRGWVTDCS